MIYTQNYDFVDVQEEVPYGDGYGYVDYSYETFTDGIAISTDADDNIISWYGYGGYEYPLKEVKNLIGLRDFIREHFKDIDYGDREEAVEELLELIQVNIDRNYRKCFNEQFAESMDALKRLGA